MSEAEKFVSKQWCEYTQEERESQVDTVLGTLRSIMVRPDAQISIKQSKPTYVGEAGELRFTGIQLMDISVSAEIKNFCRACGGMQRVPVLGVHERSKWPKCPKCHGGKGSENEVG